MPMPTLLNITIFLPLVGALLLLAVPSTAYKFARWVALLTALATAGLSFYLASAFDVGQAGVQFAKVEGAGTAAPHHGVQWIPIGDGPGIRFALGLDGVSLNLFLLTSVLMITAVCVAWESIKERGPRFYALMLILLTGLLGLFAALDVILFYVFFEFTLIPLFFLVGLYGGPQRKRASITFFLYTLVGSLLTLLGVIALAVIHSQHSDGHILTFSIAELTEGLRDLKWNQWHELSAIFKSHDFTVLGFRPAYSPQALIFLLLFAGFAIKLPLFPFHTWQPLTYVEAPTAVTILLAGVLAKVGSYGFLRFNLGMTPLGAQYFMPLMATLSVIGILYGALIALAQTDLKKLVAYSSFSHMGFICLGLFSLTAVGINGATIQMVNHGITTAALLACVGVLHDRYQTREMNEMGGLWQRLPVFAFILILAALGAAAVPFLNGFVGEFLILAGQFARSPVYAVLASIGMVLGAYYLLVMLEKVLFGKLKEPGHLLHHAAGNHHTTHGHAAHPANHNHDHSHPHAPHGHANVNTQAIADVHTERAKRLTWYELLGLVPLMVLIVGLGVYPRPILDRIGPPLQEIGKGFYQENAPARPNARLASEPGANATTSPQPHTASALAGPSDLATTGRPQLAAHHTSTLQERAR